MGIIDSAEGEEDRQFWFNTYTHQVEEGAQSDYRKLLGPYATRKDAENALETAQERNEKWDEEDARWRGDS